MVEEYEEKHFPFNNCNPLLPHSVFWLVSSIKNSHSRCHTNSYLFAYVWPYQKSTNNVWVYSHILI
ncbi:hypothetical protein DX541_09620 [Vibrio fluvialis]|nr:hypothetical protein [Vibrio fluvialis]